MRTLTGMCLEFGYSDGDIRMMTATNCAHIIGVEGAA